MRSFMQFVACELAGLAGARDAVLRPDFRFASMRSLQVSVPVLLALLIGSVQAATPATPAAMAAYADQLLDAQKIAADGPGVTVLIARGDQLLYKGARGSASLELGVPMQPDHLMRIGSVTKQFAAATLLKQIDEGKARLDDPLSKFLPDYPNGAHITLAQLLNHTSGVKSYTGIPGYMANPIKRDLTTAELIKEFKDQPVDFAPGEKWAYNNSGYVLVGAVVEAISGKRWYQQLDDALLKPAKVGPVYFEDGDRLFKGMASGYTLNGQREVAPAMRISMTQPHAAGALIANTEGLWRWNQALHGGQLISTASYARMITPEGAAKPRHYGFGLEVGTLRGHPMLAHGGGIPGFVSTLKYLPQTQTTVVILRNTDGPGFAMDTVARKLAAFAIGEPFGEQKPVAVPVEQLKAAEGVYANQEQQARTLRVKDGVLTHQRSGGSAGPLLPLGDDRFGIPDQLTELKLERDAGGRVVALLAFNNGEPEPERFARTGDLPAERATITLTPEQTQALVGNYDGPVFAIRVFVDAQGVLRGQARGQPAFALKASGPRQLFVTEVDAQLDFSGEAGKAASVTLTQGDGKIVMPRKD